MKKPKYVVKKGDIFYPSSEMKKIANLSDSKIYEKISIIPKML